MWDLLIRGAISGVTQLYIKGPLKKIWDLHKIDDKIFNIIKVTCEEDGLDFVNFLERLGLSEKFIKKRSKQFKKSFKEKKTFYGAKDLIEVIVDNYLRIFFDPGGAAFQLEPLKPEEERIIEKIRKNIFTYLMSFKPAENIAHNSLLLKNIEKQQKEQYQEIISQLNLLTQGITSSPQEVIIKLDDQVEEFFKLLQSEKFPELKVELEKIEGMTRVVSDLKKTELFELLDSKVENIQLQDYEDQIIEWSRLYKEKLDTALLYLFPKSMDDIKMKKYFVVKDYEKALFYNRGMLEEVLSGGFYKLKKRARVKGTQIIWIDTSLIEIPWGIPKTNGIPTKEGILIGIFGDMKLKIDDIKRFYTSVAAGSKNWTHKDLKNWIQGLLHSSLRGIFKHYEIKSILKEEHDFILLLIADKIKDEFLDYGLELYSFNILGIKTPDEIIDFVDQEKSKLKIIAKSTQIDLENLIQQKNHLQNRIMELINKSKHFQDEFMNGEITQEEYNKKNNQVKVFIDEAKNNLKEIEGKISNSRIF